MGILQARRMEWVAICSSRGSSQTSNQNQVSRIAGGFLPSEPPGKPKNPGVGSPSLLQGIFVTQESNGSPALQADSLPAELLGKRASLLIQTVMQCRQPRFNLWIRKIPWRREWLPTPGFLPGEFHGQRKLRATVHGNTKSWAQLSD